VIHLSRRQFVRLVLQAYRQLPQPVKQALHNVDVAVEEWPTSPDLIPLEGNSSLLGLYTGVPLVEREGGGPSLPDRIIIYRQTILRSCANRGEVVQEIRTTLWHEVGHHLGMSEDDLDRLGYG